MNIFSFFKNSSENRTQFFIVMGFIILPVVAMIYVFINVVLNDDANTSERLKIPEGLSPASVQERQE